MQDDTSHPFQNLARDLAARKRSASGKKASQGGVASSPAGKAGKLRPGEPGGSDAPAVSADAEDAALFLDAVRRIRPQGGKNRWAGTGKAQSQGEFGEALAARLSHNQNVASSVRAPVQKGRAAGESVPAPCEAAAQANVRDEALFAIAIKGIWPLNDVPPREEDAPAATARADAGEEVLFAKAMNGVLPIGGKGRAVAAPAGGRASLAAPDPARALRDVLEGRVEFALHHTDEYMEGFVVGVDPLVLARLRSGAYSPEKHLDLHGKNAQQAYEALTWFIKESYQRCLRTLVVVTGRGRNSPDGTGVLRPLLQRWLSRDPFKRVVLAFCTAKPHDGGPGAVYVLLRRYKKSRGRILWEYPIMDENFPEL